MKYDRMSADGGQRNFRIASTIGFTTCVMGTWEILLVYDTHKPHLAWTD